MGNLVLVEIFLGATSFKDLIDWFNNTFYMVRLIKYNENAFTLAKDILYTALVHLSESNMIEGFKITSYGRITVKYFLDYSDVHKYCQLTKPNTSEERLLDLIGEFKEFRNLKGVIDVDSDCYANFGKIFTFYLQNKKINNEIVNQSINQIKQNFPRVINAVLELCISKFLPTAFKAIELLKAFELGCSTGSSPFRHFNLENVENIEKKNIPYKVFREMKEDDFKELGIEGHKFLKFLPNFNIDLQIYCDLPKEEGLIIHFEITKEFNDTKMRSIKYLCIIRDFYNSIIISDVLYLYKEADSYTFFYSIPKRRFIQVEIISYEMINTTISKAFDLSTMSRSYSLYDTEDLVNNVFKLSDDSNLLHVYDQFDFNFEANEIFIVKNRELKNKINMPSLTHLEFISLLMNKTYELDHNYVIINFHEISEIPTFNTLINFCKTLEINVKLLGIKPFPPLRPNSITASHFGGFWSRVNELTRDLIFNLKRFDSLNHLIVVSNHQFIDFLEKELQKKAKNYQIMFFKDIEIDLKPNKTCDFVHIFDTQYSDYSSSSLLDYRMDFMVYLSKLGDRSRFYIQESKKRLYFQNDNLRVLYKYKEEDTIDFNSEYLFKY
ncbi:PRE-mRNA splicing helicase [Nosema bombycis CQ1]|uniref:PRE-mRNA splicing helicase n=1 Tax=Nosema bombycis (strain CQ1 / CVCC 102059) TaxID=578461 RepID=R0KS05_NOSB1|nr:PRE-mRNA splicing helicase [Nosema bombycis CQ1]|eukprot:EOB13546.1 PRE-mRNA splicing helicase [Nosema bombycis CQ1]